MKLGVLFSGGKDSTYAAWLAKKEGHKINCLISIFSKNKDSYMFHTPAIELTKKQAECMKLPIIVQETEGSKEEELEDLENAIKQAIQLYQIEGVVSGAVESIYQASRIQKICNKLGIECFNPLWQKDQLELLNDLVREKFEVIISSVAAFPLNKSWVDKKLDNELINKLKDLQDSFKINPAGEGGEFESLVLNCPLFHHRLVVELKDIVGRENAWRGIFI